QDIEPPRTIDAQPGETSPPTSPAEQPEAQEQPEASPGSPVQAEVTVVDLKGQPLANILPIATANPNAWDNPIATGGPTDSEGKTRIVVPVGEWLCLRAWDPSLRYFANNYYEILPVLGDHIEPMTIIMAQSASFELRLLRADGQPAANETVRLVLFHPSQGPWWPAESTSDAEGKVRFDAVPPGQFLMRLEATGGGQIDIPDVTLPPGSSVKMGDVTLQS
ncbi:MAG: hypothetical protein KJ052_10560, partial [Candidatus Hydrogenedentes bacterium]|nr:hypothetical protein [Candidatus Hydrogenedentota bacterium]